MYVIIYLQWKTTKHLEQFNIMYVLEIKMQNCI